MATSTDLEARAAALDRQLAREPRDTRALIERADCYAAAGDTRSAASFYQAAIRSAPQPPAGRAPDLRRARVACER